MITATMTEAYKLDCQNGVHQPNDEYMIALYDDTALLGQMTDTYTPKGEVLGKGYTVMGQLLRGRVSGRSEGIGWVSWRESPRWDNATFRARGALIYNKSKQNKALLVCTFGEVVESINAPFTITMNEPSIHTALVRIL